MPLKCRRAKIQSLLLSTGLAESRNVLVLHRYNLLNLPDSGVHYKQQHLGLVDWIHIRQTTARAHC